MRVSLRLVAALLFTAGLVAGCGGDDGDSTTNGADDGDATAEAPTDNDGDNGNGDEGSDGWPDTDLAGSGDAGTVTIDGVEYGIDETRLCDPSDIEMGDGHERTYQLQGTGLADPEDEFSEAVEVNVFTGERTNPEQDSQEIEWDGPEGLYSGEATGGGDTWTRATENLDGPPLEIGDDRATGELTLSSTLGDPPVEATVDLEVPSGEADC